MNIWNSYIELRNEEINVKKILAVINATYAVNNCEDLLYIYFFIPQFKYMNFIYS